MKKAYLLFMLALISGAAFTQSRLTTSTFPLVAKASVSKTVYKHFTLYRYSIDGMKYKSYYDNHGKWLHTIVSYEAAGLPAAVRDRINSRYNNYTISFVDEIRSPGQDPVYRVQLRRGGDLLIVQVSEDDMAEEGEYEQ